MSDINKVEVDMSLVHRLLHPRLVVLVTCVDRMGKANIITLAWSMPTSHNPKIVALSVASNRYSHQLIEETKEFVVNVPTMSIVRETLLCGRITGRKYDKFKEAYLTPLPAKMVQPPIVKECVAHLECRLNQQVTTGDHTLFLGEVLTAYVNKNIFKGRKFDLELVKPIYHCGGDDFVTLSPKIITPKI